MVFFFPKDFGVWWRLNGIILNEIFWFYLSGWYIVCVKIVDWYETFFRGYEVFYDILFSVFLFTILADINNAGKWLLAVLFYYSSKIVFFVSLFLRSNCLFLFSHRLIFCTFDKTNQHRLQLKQFCSKQTSKKNK